jgi:hypothetical protein
MVQMLTSKTFLISSNFQTALMIAENRGNNVILDELKREKESYNWVIYYKENMEI